jgi:hypothetical protein
LYVPLPRGTKPDPVYFGRPKKPKEMFIMEDNKAWYSSKTVWGGLIAVGAAIAGSFGIDVDAATQGEIADYIVVGVGAIGGIVAIIGRLQASKKIGKAE